MRMDTENQMISTSVEIDVYTILIVYVIKFIVETSLKGNQDWMEYN